jgi:class 3 adenylate cyclase
MQMELLSAGQTETARMELKRYDVRIPMGTLAIGVDNIHHDVFLSPKLVQTARDYLFDLIRQSTSATYFAGIELRTVKAPDTATFRKLVTDLMQGSLTLAKSQKNIEIDCLFRVALLKFLTQEIASQFGNLILEGKEWIRQRGEQFERSQQAHVIKARLLELQTARRGVIREVGQQIQQMLVEIDEGSLVKGRRALFGDEFSAAYGLLKNRIVFLDGGKDEHFFLEHYVLLGNYVHDPDRFEAMDELFQEMVRDAGAGVEQEPGSADAKQAYTALLEQAGAVRNEIANLEGQREAVQKKMGRGKGIFSRALSNPERGDFRASLNEIEARLKHEKLKLEELGPQIDVAKQKLDYFKKGSAGRLGDYLNEPENARWMFDASISDDRWAGVRAKRLDQLIASLEQKEILLQILAGYEIRAVSRDYSPPLHLQQLRKALVYKEDLKRVAQVLKQFPARRVSAAPLEELSRRIRRYSREETQALILKFAADFMRLRRDLRDAEHLAACMERINLVTTEKACELSRINNRLYEFVLPEEAPAASDQVISHVIIKADVRGSTQLTQDLLARGLNPASHFSLNLHEPVKKILDRYGAKKVFIEGDAIVLAIFETESNQAYQRAVAKACVLGRQILSVCSGYNDRAAASQLPRLEIGLGMAFQGSAPTYWVDGDSRIMISKALNLSDRLSGCAKLARRMLAAQKTHFSLYQFLTVMEGASAEEIEEFLIRYNLNGIELNEEGFAKLADEISLEVIETKLDMPWGKDTVTLYYGEVPVGETFELIVIRKAFAREILPDGKIGKPSSHAYYEVCTAPALHELVAALTRAQAVRIESVRH